MANLFQRRLPTWLITLITALVIAMVLVIGIFVNWLPESASTVSGSTDTTLFYLMVNAMFFVALIAGCMVFWLLYYKQTDKDRYAEGKSHSTVMEVAWTVPPLVLVLCFFWSGFTGFVNLAKAPDDAYKITVIGTQWKWAFQYPNGYIDSNLHVPAGRPIKLTLRSNDVIHSLFIPAFRDKKDVVPGRYNHMWFETPWDQDKPVTFMKNWKAPVRKYHLRCAEYCGTGHSRMNAYVIVHKNKADFDKWLDAANVPPSNPVDYGKQIWTKRCKQCHTVDGSARIGPSWKGIFGHEQELQSGKTITVDENYIHESIFYPQKKIVAGFNNQKMPSFKGQLDDRQITAVIQFIKSLSDQKSSAKTTWQGTKWSKKGKGKTKAKDQSSDKSKKPQGQADTQKNQNTEPGG